MKKYIKKFTPEIIKKVYRKFRRKMAGESSQINTLDIPVTKPELKIKAEAIIKIDKKIETETKKTEPEMDPKTEIISCLYCGSKDAIPYRKRADIVKCSSCGLVYLRTRPTKEAMYQIYQSYANDTSHMRLPQTHAEIKNNPLRRDFFVNEVLSFSTKKDGTWLDIGCGWGALLMNAREHGFAPIGIEMTRNCLDYAAMQLQIPVSNSQFTDSTVSENLCQIISMVHVLEHIPNPKETLSKIFSTLIPGGSFCGIVPNIESYCSELQKEDWVWLDETHHYVHYSPETLKQKLEQTGFEIQKIYTNVGDYNEYFEGILKKEFPLKNAAELNQKRQEIETNGKGEEIRFYVRRP